jgi:hypothetical protein
MMLRAACILLMTAASGLVAQDRHPEVLELEITIGRRPPGSPANPYLIKFAPQSPLDLEGKAAPARMLRESLAKSFRYILERQNEDGSWTYDPRAQVRPGAAREQQAFQGTAAQTLTPAVMTSLCCLALSAHEELSPGRIRPSVQRGLEYVIEHAPKHPRRDYSVWTWAFATIFLAEEHARAEDGGLKDRILKAMQATVDRILQEQHAGMPEAPKLPPKAARGDGAKDPKPSWLEKMRESMGGLIGVVPAMEQDTSGGVLAQQVQPGGPADKAGIKAGDRIFEVDGHQIGGVAHLMDVIDSLEPGVAVKVKIRRGARGAGAGMGPGTADRRAFEDGGWSYYHWSEAMSFTTATALVALLDARRAGVAVPQQAIDRGARNLEASRFRHEGRSEDGFVYRLHANQGMGVDIRGAVGRVAACFWALHRAGRADQADVEEGVRTFVRRRGELDRVKGYPGNHFVRSFANAAYYFLYGHYYAALSCRNLKDDEARRRHGAAIQEAILKTQWPEGTWTDHEAWGQLYGTAMAAMALGQLKFVSPDAYAAPLPELAPEPARPGEY